MAKLMKVGKSYKSRQYRADEREVEHDVLSTEEKIEKAQSRRGKSHREITRLSFKAEREQDMRNREKPAKTQKRK